MNRILALLALLFATSALAADNPISCSGASCKVTIQPRTSGGVQTTIGQFDGTGVFTVGTTTAATVKANGTNTDLTLEAVGSGGAVVFKTNGAERGRANQDGLWTLNREHVNSGQGTAIATSGTIVLTHGFDTFGGWATVTCFNTATPLNRTVSFITLMRSSNGGGVGVVVNSQTTGTAHAFNLTVASGSVTINNTGPAATCHWMMHVMSN